MKLRDALWHIRALIGLPMLIYSIYLICIYQTYYWSEIAGFVYITFSSFICISCLLTIILSYIYYANPENNYPYYYFSTTFGIVFSLVLTYFTTDTKRFECSDFLSSYLSNEANVGFLNQFHFEYHTSADQDFFVNTRTIQVHDALICLIVIWPCLFYVFHSFYNTLEKMLPPELKPYVFKSNIKPEENGQQPLLSQELESEDSQKLNLEEEVKDQNESEEEKPPEEEETDFEENAI